MHFATLLLAALALAGCEEPTTFETRVTLIVDSDNDPLSDAASIVLRVHLVDGELIEWSGNIDGSEVRLDDLSPAEVETLEVEVRDGSNAVTGLGRSHGFSLGEDGLQAVVFVGKTDDISRVPQSLTSARTFARGVQVPGGRIVVVGGGDNNDETIAPVDFIGWFPTEPVTAQAGAELPRIGHGVSYVPEGTGDWGGKVAVYAGTHGTGVDTLADGWDNAAPSISLIDPADGSVDHDAAALDKGYMDFRTVQTTDGLVALLGGFFHDLGDDPGPEDDSFPYNPKAVLVDPADGTQIKGPEMPSGTNREQHAAVAFEAQGEPFVLINGGYVDGGGGYLTRDVLWSGREGDDPVLLTRPAKVERARHQATDLGTGQVLITGGAGGMANVQSEGTPLATAEIFDPALDGGTFEEVAVPMMEARQRHIAARIPGGRVLICGGQGIDGVALTSCEVFGIDTRRFDAFPSSVSPGGPGMTAIPTDDGRIFFVGGATDLGPTDALHVYTPPRWQ